MNRKILMLPLLLSLCLESIAATVIFTKHPETPQTVKQIILTIRDSGKDIALSLTTSVQYEAQADFIQVSYKLLFIDGNDIQFFPNGYTLSKGTQKFYVAGDLHPQSNLKVMQHAKNLEGGKVIYPSLTVVTSLRDSSNHLVDLNRSAKSIRFTEKLINSIDQVGEGYLVEGSYWYGNPRQFKNIPQDFRIFQYKNFYTFLPEAWNWLGAVYLLKAQIMYEKWASFPEAKAPDRLHINWHRRMGLGFGGKQQITMPFYNFLDREFSIWTDLNAVPWALAHELGHSFGYNHGTLMGDRTREVEAHYRSTLVDFENGLAPHPAFELLKIYSH